MTTTRAIEVDLMGFTFPATIDFTYHRATFIGDDVHNYIDTMDNLIVDVNGDDIDFSFLIEHEIFAEDIKLHLIGG